MDYKFKRRASKRPLTVEELEAMEPRTVFQWGKTLIEHPWFNDAKPLSDGGNLEPDGRSVRVKYVVLRGGATDWKIYHSLDANLERSRYLQGNGHLLAPWGSVLRGGAGLHDEAIIRRIVPCTDEAWERYRH